ncbi:hypothetical protein KEM52_005866 [Ascosphaera acerosa]|nr:hypothetical protein KEM52_005866 [Ascosphaera acerosa]
MSQRDCDQQEAEQPRKRLKTDDGSNGDAQAAEAVVGACAPEHASPAASLPPADEQSLREVQVGITDFVSPELAGFEGVLKKRYTDFLVNEIELNGQVLHLRSTELPADFKRAVTVHQAQEVLAASSAPPSEAEPSNDKEAGTEETPQATAPTEFAVSSCVRASIPTLNRHIPDFPVSAT